MISSLRWLISLSLISFSSLQRTLVHFGGGCCFGALPPKCGCCSTLVVLSLFDFGMISSTSSAVQCSTSEESSATCCTANFGDDFSSTVDGNTDFPKNPIFWTKSTFLFPYLQLLDCFLNYLFPLLLLLSLMKRTHIIFFLQPAFNLQGRRASMWRVHVLFKFTSSFSCQTILSPGVPRWLFGSSVLICSIAILL